MNMDRNTVIGFVLLALLLFAYLFFAGKNTRELQYAEQLKQDSIAKVKARQDSINYAKDTAGKTIVIDSNTVGFQKLGVEQLTTVENEVIKVTFTNKGGQVKSVELKNYNSYTGKPAKLSGADFDKVSYTINTGNNLSAPITDLYFQTKPAVKNADGSQSIEFTAVGSQGEQVKHEFVVRPNSYMIDWTPSFTGADKLFTQRAFNLTWQNQPAKLESDAAYERQQTSICYMEDGSFDYIQTKTELTFEKPVSWLTVSQHFFNITLYAKNNFTSGDLKLNKKAADDSSDVIANATATMHAKLPVGAQSSFPMQLFFGPNDYKILKSQPIAEMDRILNLGRDMYSFVRPINVYVIYPVFNFIKGFVLNFGIVIALLTIFIRVVTSPLLYNSYVSSAKMKALRPEIDKLKAKHGSDQQAFGMDQMKLFREAGVNPLGGCIPALLQIPIFFALYSFFNSNIDLRGQEFLWSHNLASYDSIVNFGFNVWGLGNHLSLFTLTAAGTSFLISLYNSNMTPDQNNPALKYMPYIFPFILLFIFNRLPSALTWYYTVSNLITLILQFVIQNYIIDHDKILAKIEENRKKPKAKSKWAERMEQMQEAQKQMQDARKKK
ncbi:MAG: membrane protein insertase YidC [Chitinophagaceae bacterium]|nr:membrane protein insertase YidC [Chitinophagaceae bacterium]